MTPTPAHQHHICEAAYEAWRKPGNGSIAQCAMAAVAKWEEIRPCEDPSQMQRTNQALGIQLQNVTAELNARLHERTQAFLTKEIALTKERDDLDKLCIQRGVALLDAKREEEALRDEVQRLQAELEEKEEELLDAARELGLRSEPDVPFCR